MKDKHKTILFYSVIGLILLAGTVVRVLFFSYGRPFWNDESAMALNLVDRSFLGLFAPLDYNQLTPPLYSVVCKFCSLFVHKPEYAYRLPALICSIVSLGVFYAFSKKVLNNAMAVVFANAVFALNYHIIYYAQELKQYSCDVLLFLTILLSYFLIHNKFESQSAFARTDFWLFGALSVFYAASMWFSYTALFAMFVVFLTMLMRLFLLYKHKSGDSESFDYMKYAGNGLKRIAALFSLPAASFTLLCLNVTRFAKDTALHDFWTDGFVAKNFSNLPELVYNNTVFYFPDLKAKIVLVALFFAGMCYAFKSIFGSGAQFLKLQLSEPADIGSVDYMKLLVVSVVLAFVLSYFNIYPLYLRTALYLFPVIVLIMACAFEYGFFSKNKAGAALCVLCTVLMMYVSFKTDEYQILQKQYYRENTAQMLEAYKKNAAAQDKLIVPSLSSINYEYYSRFAGIDSKNVYYIKYALYEYSDIKTAYDTLPENAVYYILVTHSGDKAYELKNLEKYAFSQKECSVISDKFDNALIRFRK